MKRRVERGTRVEQLSVFEGMEPGPGPTLASDTMRQIVSLRMPDALIERLEAAAHARGVSPSSLMRAFIASGLDRSYAAITESELAAELSALRRRVDEIADRLALGDVTREAGVIGGGMAGPGSAGAGAAGAGAAGSGP